MRCTGCNRRRWWIGTTLLLAIEDIWSCYSHWYVICDITNFSQQIYFGENFINFFFVQQIRGWAPALRVRDNVTGKSYKDFCQIANILSICLAFMRKLVAWHSSWAPRRFGSIGVHPLNSLKAEVNWENWHDSIERPCSFSRFTKWWIQSTEDEFLLKNLCFFFLLRMEEFEHRFNSWSFPVAMWSMRKYSTRKNWFHALKSIGQCCCDSIAPRKMIDFYWKFSHRIRTTSCKMVCAHFDFRKYFRPRNTESFRLSAVNFKVIATAKDKFLSMPILPNQTFVEEIKSRRTCSEATITWQSSPDQRSIK